MLLKDRKKKLKQLIEKLDIKNTDLELLDVALTHPSFNFEQNIENASDYERLEFLGDSVIRLIISEYLFDAYKEYPEGKLTKIRSYLVSDELFAKIALNLKIDEYINIGHHEEKDGGRTKQSILACALEALWGAVYKSLGFKKVKEFIYKIYKAVDFDVNQILYAYNSKEILQQYTQSDSKSLPVYTLINETGKAHDKTYEVSVSYKGNVLGTGIAKTKKEAEKIAAYNAIEALNIIQE